MTDVLGLVSFLKEERNCKVIMLLNSSELPSADGSAFDLFLEKVVDRSLEFSPTPEECAKIAFDEDDDISREVSRHVVSFKDLNIRVMRKLDGIARQLNDALHDYDKEGFRQDFTHGVTGVGIPPTHCRTKSGIPDHEEGRGPFWALEEKRSTPEEANWNTLLDAYGYIRTDEFDLVLLKCVQRGYFDRATLDSHAKSMHDEIVAGNAANLMDKALRLFYGSFSMDEAAVLDAIDKEFVNRSKCQFEHTQHDRWILQRLDRPQQAGELIQFYVTHRDQGKDGWDLERAYGVDGLDADVRRAFQKKYSSFPTEMPDTEALLRALVEHKKRIRGRICHCSAVTSVEDYYKVFKSTADLPAFLSTIFRYRQVINPTPAIIRIMERATQALRQLGLKYSALTS